MNDRANSWHRRLGGRLRGWGGLIVGLIIGATAFGVSTAGAGGDLQDPGGPQQIKEECAEGCDFEEVREWTWNGEPFLEHIWSPPPTTTPVRVATNG